MPCGPSQGRWPVPVMLLPPRMTDDSQALQQASETQGWQVERLANWRPPSWLRDEELVLYGEPLFADVVAGPLGLALLECPPDWLTRLPSHLSAAQRTLWHAGRGQTLHSP